MYGDQNQPVLDAVRRWPDRFVGFAYLGAFDQPDTPDLLERLIDMGMTGLKVELALHAAAAPDLPLRRRPRDASVGASGPDRTSLGPRHQ